MPKTPHFAREHIESEQGFATPVVTEQALHSLELVAALSATDLAFRFKGGNSLLLLLEKPLRFSMDVDVATDEPRERIEASLDEAVRSSPALVRWARRRHKTKPWLPLASFEVYYDSHYLPKARSFIFLDAQLKASLVPGTRVPVRCGTLYSSDRTVEVPTRGGLLGDKLLTLGPRTLGIPLGRNKEAQRLKHVFDVATLAGLGPDPEEVRESVRISLEQENELQERAWSLDEVCRDTLSLCSTVVPHTEAPGEGDLAPVLSEIVRGMGAFAEHLFSREYGWRDLQADLAVVALTVAMVLREDVDARSFTEALSGCGAVPPQGPLHALSKTHPRAAIVWACAADWLTWDPTRS